MDSKNQFTVFLLCVLVGFFGGVLYEFFYLVGLPFCRKGKGKWLRILLDTAFWISFALLSVAFSYLWKFPSLRLYTWIGYLLGGIIYAKILRRIVAFFLKMWYNKRVERRKRKKTSEKT